MLPRIKISFLNGQLGTVPPSEDGLLLLLQTATVVSSTFELDKPYLLYRLESLTPLGVTKENNADLYEMVRQFYAETPEGTPVYVMGTDKAKTMTDIADKASGPLPKILRELRGRIRGIVISRRPAPPDTPTQTEGLDPDVFTALAKAQELAGWAVSDLYAPVFVALEGRSYKDAASLKDLSKGKDNYCCIVIGDTADTAKNAAMGTFAGRVAIAPVQRNIGRVRDGKLAPAKMYIGASMVEEVMDDVATIYAKGYITPRVYAGKTGYYWTDDQMACEVTDDYAHLAHRRTIDKAYRIAYNTLLDYLNDEVQVNADGTMQAGIIKSWQASVENAIDSQMTALGELSADDGAATGGCKCVIDTNQNVLSTSKVKAVLKVRPYGYARYIDVELGFLVESA